MAYPNDPKHIYAEQIYLLGSLLEEIRWPKANAKGAEKRQQQEFQRNYIIQLPGSI